MRPLLPYVFGVVLTSLRQLLHRSMAMGGLALAATPWLACQPVAPTMETPPDETLPLAELIYTIGHENAAQLEPCGEALQEAIAEDHDAFIETFDAVVSDEVLDATDELAADLLLPLIQDEILDRVLDTVHAVLFRLIDRDADPDLATLTALTSLTDTRTVLQARDVIAWVRHMLADPETREVIRALAELATTDDGVDTVVGSLFDLVGRLIDRVETAGTCEGDLEVDRIVDLLLVDEGWLDEADFGEPAWGLRADVNGNPQPRLTETGQLPSPFVDRDGDGVVDVNADGAPVDAQGDPIALAPFGSGAGYTNDHRLLAAGDDLVFVTYDTKRAALSQLAQWGRAFLEDGLHDDAVALLTAAMGDPVVCDDGTDTCRAYASEHNVIADLVYQGLALAEIDDFAAAVATLDALVTDDPILAEDIVVLVGQIVEALESEGISVRDPALLRTVQDFLPLMDEIFEADNSTGDSTASLLFDLVVDLGHTSRQFPEQLRWTIAYSEMEKDAACSDGPPNFEASTAVDYSLPRWPESGGDNRSNLEESVELLHAVECGRVPFTGGQTVAEVIIDLMSGLSPDTVCTIIDVFLGVMDLVPGVSEFIGANALSLIGCDGHAVWDRLMALDGLAKSGALDFYLPLAEVFVEQDQIGLLLDIFDIVVADLLKDDDGDPATVSVIRAILPVAERVIASGAVDHVFDLLDVLVALEVPGTDRSMARVLVDTGAVLVDDDTPVDTRQGPRDGVSPLGLLLSQLVDIETRVAAANANPSLDRLLDWFWGFITTTEVDDQGTVDPEDDRIILGYRNLLDMWHLLFSGVAEVLRADDATRGCYIDLAQDELISLVTGRELATGVRLIETLQDNPHGEVLEDALIQFMTPTPPGPDDRYGSMTRVVGALLQVRVDNTHLRALLSYLRALLSPEVLDPEALLPTVVEILDSEQSETVWTLLENLVDQGDDGWQEAPIEEAVRLALSWIAVAQSDTCSTDPSLNPETLESAIAAILTFMDDPDYGLPAILALVQDIAAENGAESSTEVEE